MIWNVVFVPNLPDSWVIVKATPRPSCLFTSMRCKHFSGHFSPLQNQLPLLQIYSWSLFSLISSGWLNTTSEIRSPIRAARDTMSAHWLRKIFNPQEARWDMALGCHGNHWVRSSIVLSLCEWPSSTVWYEVGRVCPRGFILRASTQ